MSNNARLLGLSTLLISLNACGYMVQVNKQVDYQTVALGSRRGDLWKYASQECKTCTESFLLSNWGEPTSRELGENGVSIWTYNNGLKWVGGSPVVILPLPLFVPSGKEKIQFGIKDGGIPSSSGWLLGRLAAFVRPRPDVR